MSTLVQRDPAYHIQQMLGAYYFPVLLIFPSKDNDNIVLSMMGNPNMLYLITWLDN